MGVRAYTPFLLSMPEVLNAIGIAPDLRQMRLMIEKNGARRTISLAPAGLFPILTGDIDRSWVVRPGWIDAREHSAPALWLRDITNQYRFEYLAGQRVLYCQISTIQQKTSDSLRAFMARAIATADSASAERFVLDLRLNGGGNGGYNRDILLPLIKSRYDVPGRLYVITGRRTFSAAQMLVTELMKYSTAVFVGEPTSSHGNHFGDSYRIVMPNSRVTLRVSTLWHQYLDSRDKRLMIEPAIAAPLSFADYLAGRDPALEAVFHDGRAK
jgi:C-terminal processing protease CtpA/Prc